MKELSVLLVKLGFEDAKTYLQRGNVVYHGRGAAADQGSIFKSAILKIPSTTRNWRTVNALVDMVEKTSS